MTGPAPSRPGSGPSVAPDGSMFAHIVDAGGYPRAVQRYLNGLEVTRSRFVTLPVEGPITKVMHSPDSRWLACQTSPHAGNRSQVWVVTTDPADPGAWRVDDPDAPSADLVGWNGRRVAITIEHADGTGEARLVNPGTGTFTVLDRRTSGRLLDSWDTVSVVRVGPRCDRSLRILRGSREVPVFADESGASSEQAVILDDHRPVRVRLGGPGDWTTLLPAGRFPSSDTEGFVRLLVRSDHGAAAMRLVQVTMTPQGEVLRVLAERPDAELDEFTVSADTSTAALLWNVEGGRSELQVLELADGTLHPPVPLAGDVASQLSMSADGSVLALTVEGPGQPRTVELLNPRTGDWSAVDRVRRDRDAVRPRLVRFSARDGVELTAWWYPSPVGPVPAPTIVDFHGGPEGQARPGHNDYYPKLLAAGWDVVAPNVRGSAGFGREFVHADDREKRYRGLDDVADVVEHFVTTGRADPDLLVCSGRSYGGYLTLASLTRHPDLFVAGVSTCGMSDLTTFYATTEPWIAAAAVSKYGDPDRDSELLADLSPLRRVDQVRVPVLFIHGSHDTNVPPAESIQMAEAIRENGGRADVLIVPDEGHQIAKPENRDAVGDHLRRWLAEVTSDSDSAARTTHRPGQVGPSQTEPPSDRLPTHRPDHAGVADDDQLVGGPGHPDVEAFS